MSKPLSYGRQWIDDDDVAAVTEQLKSDWLTQGPTVRKFEEALCTATGARYAVAVSSGTAALHIACLAAGVRNGDVGLTADITFVASANAIRYCGGKARLVDVDPETALASAEAFEEAAKKAKPKVMIPVDFSGSVADLPGLRAVADRHGAMVIEDAAHSLGATYGSHRAGSCAHTHMACLSFHPVKHVTTGEGGAVTTNDKALYTELCELRTHGITRDPKRMRANDGPWYYEQRQLGFNYRITDVQCALGVSQMAKLERFVARRRAIVALYDVDLQSKGLAACVRRLAVPKTTHSSFHLMVIRLVPRAGESLEQLAERRKAVFIALREKNILAQVHYVPVHRQPDFEDAGMSGGSFPGAEAYYAGCLSLPMFPALTDDDVHRVTDELAAMKGGLL